MLGLLKEYVGVRRRSAELRLDIVEYQSLAKRTRELQSELWEQAVSAGQRAPSPITGLFESSLDETIELAEKRRAGVENRVPVMLFLIALLTSTEFPRAFRREANELNEIALGCSSKDTSDEPTGPPQDVMKRNARITLKRNERQSV